MKGCIVMKRTKRIVASLVLMITIIGALSVGAFAGDHYSTQSNYNFDYSYPSNMQYFFNDALYCCYTARNLNDATSYAKAKTYGMVSSSDNVHCAVVIIVNAGHTQHRKQSYSISNNGNGYNIYSGQANGSVNKDVIRLQHWVFIEDIDNNEILYSREVN